MGVWGWGGRSTNAQRMPNTPLSFFLSFLPLQAWAQEQGLSGDDAELCGSETAKRWVQSEVESTGRAGGLKVRSLLLPG